MVLYTPRWTREFYFASDEGASKIIVESSPRGIKPLFARLIPGFIFILWHFTFVQSARVAFAGTEPIGYKYENFLLCLVTSILSINDQRWKRTNIIAVIVYCYFYFIPYWKDDEKYIQNIFKQKITNNKEDTFLWQVLTGNQATSVFIIKTKTNG